jgi:hypothetical protein
MMYEGQEGETEEKSRRQACAAEQRQALLGREMNGSKRRR